MRICPRPWLSVANHANSLFIFNGDSPWFIEIYVKSRQFAGGGRRHLGWSEEEPESYDEPESESEEESEPEDEDEYPEEDEDEDQHLDFQILKIILN